jgi:hypothetical protein
MVNFTVVLATKHGDIMRISWEIRGIASTMFGKGTLRAIPSGNLTLTWEICNVFVMGMSFTHA